jgi:murein DD-endopeptidase MepM/ murein hydrolase activator NlpD
LKRKSEMEERSSFLSLFGAACLLIAGQSAGAGAAMVSTNSSEVLQGEIVELKVSGAGLADVKGWMRQQSIQFYPAARDIFAALIGVDLEAKPGPVKIAVRARAISGEHLERELQLEIKPKIFQQEELAVAPSFDQLSREVIDRIRREQERLEGVFATSIPVRLWDGPFVQPVSGSVTSPFGYRRVVNGVARAPHTGTDLRAPLGTEVSAANHGRVALLGDFFFGGKSLVLDHGAGLFTMYFHLSEFKVQEGAAVQRGEIIALSGMSGRVTGPHLHWAARINKARIDPFELLKKLGENSPASFVPASATEKSTEFK